MILRPSMAVLALALFMSSAMAQTAIEQRRVPTQPPGKAGSGLGGVQPPSGTSPAPAFAQQPARPAQGVSQPAAAAQPGQAGQPGQPAQRAVVPMSESVYRQAVQQSEGVYPQMDRAGAGGQIQDAWNVAEKREGVYVTRLCTDCVYKVRTREMMTTTLVLPDDAVITTHDLGDPTGFMVQVRGANKVAVRPSAYGMDTNLNVYTKSGAVYPFYIRSESFNSIFVPDLIVKIVGQEKPAAIEGAGGGESPAATGSKPGGKLTAPAKGNRDFVRNVPMDLSKFHGWHDYDLSGDSELKPEVIWRDDFFTYIQYGQKWDGMELSTAYATIDDIDELVNTHVEGTIFVIESVTPHITLKNGKKFLCIQYTGDKP